MAEASGDDTKKVFAKDEHGIATTCQKKLAGCQMVVTHIAFHELGDFTVCGNCKTKLGNTAMHKPIVEWRNTCARVKSICSSTNHTTRSKT